MVTVTARYEGDLRCEVRHGPSNCSLITDAPIDNHGKGESFSPTDLVAAALGSCMLTVMGIAARKLGVDLNGATAITQKTMIASPVRRIAALLVQLHLPAICTPEQRDALEKAARECPVHHSLHPGMEIGLEFIWA